MGDDLVASHAHRAFAVSVGEIEADLGEDLALGQPPKRLGIHQDPVHIEDHRAHLSPVSEVVGFNGPPARESEASGLGVLLRFGFVGGVEEVFEIDGRLRFIVELVSLVLPPLELVLLLLLFLQLFLSFFEFV